MSEKALRSVVVEQSLSVDISSASLVVHQSNSIVEHRLYLFELRVLLAQSFYSLVNCSIGFLEAAEERKKLVHQVRLTVFFGAL